LNSDEISILAASDWAPIRAFESVILRDPAAVYGDILPVLRAADLRIVNCECALTGAAESVWKSGAVFKGLPAHAAGLTAVPFEVACLANNHVFDYGLRGFRETLHILRRNRVWTVGAGLDPEEARAPLTLGVGRTKVSIVNFSEGEDLTAVGSGAGVCGWEIDRLIRLVRTLKKRGHLVIAVGHAGLEYVPFAPPYVVAAFRALSDAGADCVIGHHPHVPQGLEKRKGRLIAYSLGNFVFYQPTDLIFRRTGFCLTVTFRKGALVSHRLHPYRITETGLRKLPVREEKAFLIKIDRISESLKTPESVRLAWQAYLDHYGIRGFKEEVAAILDRMGSDPRKGAAMFRNRITTLQHSELWRDVLTRIMSAGEERSPAWMSAIVREWFERKV
jgi:poly-gamma-glutamate capsule biosynthesis protein CapA/YwtB (metallophosphatase superfamily)